MRNYVRKTDRGKTPSEVIERAIDVVLTEERGITEVGELFQIPRRSLARYVDKKKNELSSKQKYGYAKIRQVFTDEEETILVKFLHRAADIYFGLSPLDVRKLAFQLATKMNIKTPLSWNAKCIFCRLGNQRLPPWQEHRLSTDTTATPFLTITRDC
ncbi:hypothetical protein GHT06_020291 [Daphnia sinensis]|uniref:HTH psq-type domain-containing protein n=1 Tax=Daphnia sinensis TaxID=1820382 RepID=A0AAD5PTV5_9CRUS|nr:hypothetical protein GHT06_020291 [Daphnia sinensis]